MGSGKTVCEIRQSWTNARWARHLGVKPEEVPELKKIVKYNYIPCICGNEKQTGWRFELLRRHDTPSGCERYLPLASHNKIFRTARDAVEFSNNEIIPNLKLTKFTAEINHCPVNLMQLMCINFKNYSQMSR